MEPTWLARKPTTRERFSRIGYWFMQRLNIRRPERIGYSRRHTRAVEGTLTAQRYELSRACGPDELSAIFEDA